VATSVIEISTSAQQLGIASNSPLAGVEHPQLGCLSTSQLFLDLNSSEQHEIARSARQLFYAAGEIIFLQNNPVRHVFVVASGAVKVTQVTEDGKEILLRVEHPGGLLDDVIASGLRHPITARALQDCALLVWEAADFEVLTRHICPIQRNATAILRTRLKVLQERFCDVATRPVPQRLARLVIHLAEKSPGEFAPVELSREELAQMAGTSLFTVSRFLGRPRHRRC
jgi:CRP/FNR family transcriptional regulator, nitrogen oxide reductase regulator